MISLGLLFLILTANLTILDSASQSSSQARATREALDLAREGLEEVIAAPPKPGLTESTFGSRSGSVEGFTFTRKIKVTALSGEHQGLLQALVTVDWGRNRTVRLERYVAKI